VSTVEKTEALVSKKREFQGQEGSKENNVVEIVSVNNTRQSKVKPTLDRKLVNALILWVERRYIKTGRRDQEFIVGIGTSWISDMQLSLSEIQIMLHQGLKKLNRKKGLGNIEIVISNDPVKLAELIKEKKEQARVKIPLDNIAILEESSVLSSDVFSEFHNDKESAYFGKIKLPEKYHEIASNLDIDLTRLLIMFLNKISMPNSSHEIFLNLPDITEYKLGELVEKYDLRTESLVMA
jgi:hypothetical protein